MPTQTYLPLQTITLTASASSITFDNIPNSFRDLVIHGNFILASNGNDGYVRYQFNNDTTAGNYTGQFIDTYNNTLQAGATNNLFYYTTPISFGTVSNSALHINDYAKSDRYKMVISRFSTSDNNAGMYTVRWANNAAITKITLVPTPVNFSAGTTVSIYGIAG